jgi:hypothetical protein
MTFKTDARIQETSSTTGTGTYTLIGAATGFQSFAIIGANNHCPYFATDGTDWEEGIGKVLTGPNRLERTTIFASSNAGSEVDWAAGTRTLRCGPIGAFGVPRPAAVSIAGGAGTQILTQPQQRVDVLTLGGAITGNRTVEVDNTVWHWAVYNNTTGDFTVTFKVTGGTGVTIGRGERVVLYCDGVDVFKARTPYIDTEAVVQGSADPTKKLRVEVDGFTSGTTRVLTPPNYDGTIATLAGTETFTNKSMTTPAIASATLSGTTNNSGATISGGTITGATINADSNTISNIDQGNLKTATASGSVSVAQESASSYSLTGGTYSWWTASADAAGVIFGNGNQGAGVIGLFNFQLATNNFYVDERYVQASPPYNLGNGDIPLFVFVMLDSLGAILGVSVAPDPTWSYHGPTIITPERVENGKAYRRYREINGVPFRVAMQNQGLRMAFLRGQVEAELVEREITQAIKNADKDLFPHPWCQGNDLTGRTVVMLDPLSPLVSRFQLMHEEGGAAEIRDLIRGGALNIGNTRLNVAAPQGVMPVAGSLK